MIRRLKKVTSQAELQQLIEAGIIVSPYIAFDSSSNVTNMVLPAEREISEIEYEQEVSGPVKLVGPVNIEYYTQEGYTAGTLSFTVNAEQTDKSMIAVVACQKTHFDEVCLRDPKTSREEMIAQLIVDTLKYVPGVEYMEVFSPVHCFGTSWSLPQNEEDENVLEKGILKSPYYPWGEDVIYTVDNENLAADDLIWVPYDNAYPTDNTYYIFAGYYSAGVQGPSDIANACQLAQYRVMPYLSDSSTFVYEGMNLVSYEKLDPVTGESMGQYRNFEARVPGNTVYDRARYAWILEGDDWADAMAENSRTATCDATTTFSFSDYDAPEYINETDQTLEGFILVQLYNSVTGDESEIKDFSTMYVEPSESVWSSPQLVPNMYTTDSSNGIYTDTSGNFEITYDADDEGNIYIGYLGFYLDSQYLEGWGSTAETIATDTAFNSNTPHVFITEKDALDAVVEYWSNTGGFSESYTLAHLVWDVVNEGREISGGAGVTTSTWPFSLSDGSETSFWGEDIQYNNDDVVSLGGFNYMCPDNDNTPEYYILVAYRKEEEVEEILEASKDNILRAPVDYESTYKVYKAGIFRAYDYSEEGEDDDTTSDAYISSFDEDPQQEWTDDGGNVHAILVPTIEMTNNDAYMNYFQLGMYDAAEEGNAWDPIERLYESACDNSYIELSSVFNGETSASFSAGAYMNVDSYQQANDGTTFKFVGRYVNGYVQTATDDYGNQYEELVISEAKPWIVLGQYPAPEPEVMFDTASDDGNGTITFEAWNNVTADEQGCYYKVGRTSNEEWANIMSQSQDMADYDEYIQNNCLDNATYSGTQDNKDSITVTYPTSMNDSGSIVVALFDSEDNYISYWEVTGWVWPAM